MCLCAGKTEEKYCSFLKSYKPKIYDKSRQCGLNLCFNKSKCKHVTTKPIIFTKTLPSVICQAALHTVVEVNGSACCSVNRTASLLFHRVPWTRDQSSGEQPPPLPNRLFPNSPLCFAFCAFPLPRSGGRRCKVQTTVSYSTIKNIKPPDSEELLTERVSIRHH